jgi:hypothetical protein
MKRWLGVPPAMAILVAINAGTGRLQAGCSSCGAFPLLSPFTAPIPEEDGFHDGGPAGEDLPGWGGYGLGWWGVGGFDWRLLIFPPPNRANYYPDGGFTFYDGEMCSCLHAHSNYSRMDWFLPAAMTARTVLDKLKELGIPRVSPEPQFLNKNPRIAEGIRLPIPPRKEKEPGEE